METSTGNGKAEPLLNNKLLLFMVAMILANMGGEMYGMLLPLYLKELNASVVQIGLFFTISQIVPLAVQILGGWISDSLGRLRSVAIGSLAGNLVFVGFILGTHLAVGDEWHDFQCHHPCIDWTQLQCLYL